MITQMLLECDKYVAIILLVPCISGLQNRLNHALENLKLPAPGDDPVEIVAKKTVIPCVEALVEDFDIRAGNSEIALVYKEGDIRQLQGLRQE